MAKSTFSEAVDGLVERGLVDRLKEGRLKEGRSKRLQRTAAWTRAMSGSSVLEAVRLRRLLRKLSEESLAQAVAGLELLAEGELR